MTGTSAGRLFGTSVARESHEEGKSDADLGRRRHTGRQPTEKAEMSHGRVLALRRYGGGRICGDVCPTGR